MRLGIYGGSFDPVHIGHLLVAESCREQARLDRVLFVPAATPPHKQGQQLAPGVDRLAMLTLATGGHPGFEVLGTELDRRGISWTVDTLEALAAESPTDSLHLILGPDALAGFPGWRDPGRILELATPLAVEREGVDDIRALVTAQPLLDLLGPARAQALADERVICPAVGIRSSQIRAAIRAGHSIRYRTPAAVDRYIATHGLYRSPPE